jgi:hypothetical protein
MCHWAVVVVFFLTIRMGMSDPHFFKICTARALP